MAVSVIFTVLIIFATYVYCYQTFECSKKCYSNMCIRYYISNSRAVYQEYCDKSVCLTKGLKLFQVYIFNKKDNSIINIF